MPLLLALFLIACADHKGAESTLDPVAPVKQSEQVVSNSWKLPHGNGEFEWFQSRLYPENVGEKKYTLSLRWAVKDVAEEPRIQPRFEVRVFDDLGYLRGYSVNANKTGRPASPYSPFTLRTPLSTILDELTYERSLDMEWGKKYRVQLSAGGIFAGSAEHQVLRIFEIVLSP
jgi:hypothetical protein